MNNRVQQTTDYSLLYDQTYLWSKVSPLTFFNETFTWQASYRNIYFYNSSDILVRNYDINDYYEGTWTEYQFNSYIINRILLMDNNNLLFNTYNTTTFLSLSGISATQGCIANESFLDTYLIIITRKYVNFQTMLVSVISIIQILKAIFSFINDTYNSFKFQKYIFTKLMKKPIFNQSVSEDISKYEIEDIYSLFNIKIFLINRFIPFCKHKNILAFNIISKKIKVCFSIENLLNKTYEKRLNENETIKNNFINFKN